MGPSPVAAVPSVLLPPCTLVGATSPVHGLARLDPAVIKCSTDWLAPSMGSAVDLRKSGDLDRCSVTHMTRWSSGFITAHDHGCMYTDLHVLICLV